MLIQVSVFSFPTQNYFNFDLENTFDREVKVLLKITEVLDFRLMFIITRDTERMLEISGKKIEVVTISKWLLNFKN